MIGRTLNHYRILKKIASGGMGEVYLAQDTNLDRQIALKLLPPEMAREPERLHRFEREAKAVAALNHPNIVTIHSIESAEGMHFLTMEFVRGRPLSRLIPRRGMELDPLLDIGISMAEAMGAAHEKGITHRDLKPANVMVSDAGRVKILDFGLAKLMEEAAQELADTELPRQGNEHLTQAGRVLGTVAYMSPEQAEGKPVDPRSDVFSLGVLLFQMATGERPFKGDSKISVLSSLLRDTPPSITQRNESLPHHLGRIVRICLAKDPDRRYLDARDLRNELLELKEEIDSGDLLVTGEGAAVRRKRSMPLAWVMAAPVAIAATGFFVYQLLVGPRDPAGPLAAAVAQLTARPGQEIYPSVSPDGRRIVFASQVDGEWNLMLQRVGGETVFNLTGDSGFDDTQPAFSPDGERIAFRSDRHGGGLYIMGATGESVRRLTGEGFLPSWSPDGRRIAYATQGFFTPMLRQPTSEIRIFDLDARTTRTVAGSDATQPSWSPNGHRIAYWGLQGASGRRDIWTVAAGGGPPVPVTDDTATDWNPIWSPDGRFLYFASDRSGTMSIWRVFIDERSGAVRGAPQAVTSGVFAAGYLAVARETGQIVYSVDVSNRNILRIPIDPGTGQVTGPPVAVTRGSGQMGIAGISSDEEWVAFATWGRQEDLFVMRADGSERRRLTEDLHKDRWPKWAPGGDRIVFHSDRSGSYELWSVAPDGSGLRQLTDTPGGNVMIGEWSPDGGRISAIWNERTFVFDPDQPWNQQKPDVLPPWSEAGGYLTVTTWAPSGDRVAGYVIDAVGELAGFASYSFTSGRYQMLLDRDVLTEEADWPMWLSDGRRLVYSDAGRLFLYEPGGTPQEIFSVQPDALYLSAVGAGDRSLYYIQTRAESDLWLLTLE